MRHLEGMSDADLSGRTLSRAPVCPLTPRAAPVAVNSTIASRKRLMFAVSVCFCSSVSFGFVGSSLILGER